MKIRTELSLVFLACCVIPLVLCAGVNYYSALSSSSEISDSSKELLTNSVRQSLTQTTQEKKHNIQNFLKTVSDQASTFAARIDVQDACQAFSKEFANGKFHKEVTEEEMAKVNKAIKDFYQVTFANQYKSLNDGDNINIDKLLSGLDQQSRLMQFEYIVANPNKLGEKDKLMASGYNSEYTISHQKYHPSFRKFLNKFSYYDVFICDTEGRIVYSVFKELDYGTSLKNGPFADSNIAEAFQKAILLPKGQSVSVDFKPYQPSYDSPAGFTGSPIYAGNKLVGAAIFQVPLQRINDIMVKDSNIGETAESYLIGPDKIVRSDSLRDPKNRSLQNAFRNPQKAIVNTDTSNRVLNGETGFNADATNYLGTPVLASFSPMEIPGLKWGIITEVSQKEALAPAETVSTIAANSNYWFLVYSIGGLVFSTIIIIAASQFLGQRFTTPIHKSMDVLNKVANGDLSTRLPEDQENEFGQMAKSLNTACDRIGSTIETISQSTNTLNAASVHLSTNSKSLSSDVSNSRSQTKHVSEAVNTLNQDIRSMTTNSEQMSANMRSVATGVDQMTQTIAEIAGNAEQSAAVAQEAAQLATVSNSQISDLGSAADEIGKVIEVIQDIAEQTNLLALNATIEAARAGEAGKGFAVVATEVKELAKQTGAATDDIRSRIEGIQDSSAKAVSSIREISEVVEKVNLVATTIASAVEEQNLTTKEMARHIKETAEAAEDVSSRVARTGQVAEDITTTISSVDEVIGRTVDAADDSLQQGNDLLRMASEMQDLVQQFKVGHSKMVAAAR